MTPPEPAVPGVAQTAPGGVVLATVPLPRLPRPGLAFLETSRGDVLGPWLPLLVAPSRAVAQELCRLVEQRGGPVSCTRPPVQLFLADLGRLLSLDIAGACLEGSGYTDDWAAYEAYRELRDAMPDAAAAAARLLRRCIEWCLPECTALAANILLSLLQ
ncbi:hypothetical protein GPECTOR_50g633 [Gonium pectorale]|uniref:Uncharacterized protein n=1 Tax=Gonium pectorale TaxID=33097 RepID=A0A150G7J9_GONPE|nr:hypothetical protein GPECTOR_50g633 [Gonium pectorale]|eukprot:KXZ45839.1 hypothetical protein GPECTOR_50g633 [Gonium pectorale]